MPKQKWSATGFGDRLKAIREESGKSQQQLADAVGVDVMTVSRLERGGQEPAWPLALALAKALGVSCEAFEQPLSDDQPTPKRGRPRKVDPAEGEVPTGKKGKPRKKEGTP